MGGCDMMFAALLCCTFLISLTEGSKCRTIMGSWFNEQGEEVVLLEEDDGVLYGKFKTDLERAMGSPGKMTHSELHGFMPYKEKGDVFGFTVSFRNGAATKTWTGQCQICSDGAESLVMSWVTRTRANTCRDKWKSTMIGQDVFTRQQPSVDQTIALEHENNIPYVVDFVGVDDKDQNRPPGQSSEEKNKCSNLSGVWYNDVGSEVILSYDPSGVITGEYRTGVERVKGSAGSSHSKVFGYRNAKSANATLTLFVVWKNGASISGFVGQCHVCSPGGEPAIQTAWILRMGIKSCDDNWKSTMFGQNTFTRIEQKTGPRKKNGEDTPIKDGEADSLTLCGAAVAVKSSLVFSLFISLNVYLLHLFLV